MVNQSKCPCCGDSNFNSISQGGMGTVNTPNYTLFVCSECGGEFSHTICPNCGEVTCANPVYDHYSGNYSYNVSCARCNQILAMNIPGDEVDDEQRDEAKAACTSGKCKPFINNHSVGQVAMQVNQNQPVQVPVQTGHQLLNALANRGPSPSQRKGGIVGMNNVHVQNCEILIHETHFIDDCNKVFGTGGYTQTRQRTKAGKDVIVIEPKSGGKMICFVDNITKEVAVRPNKFATRSWIEPTYELVNFIHDIAIEHKGSMEGYTDQNGPVVVIAGQPHTGDFFIVKKGSIPNFDNTSEDLTGSDFRVIKPLKEYLTENPQIQAQIQGQPFPDNVNTLGKILISERRNDKLSFEIFKNLLIQVVTVGANDPTVKNMYDFIV